MLKRMRYSVAILLGLLAGCTPFNQSNVPIQPIFQPVSPEPTVVTNPQRPVREDLFNGIIGLKTGELLAKVGAPWRIVPGVPEAWHYRVDRLEDDTTTDAEIFVKDGKVVDANVDF